jgi:hypothetical protein
VTEVEWLACTEPDAMLEFLQGKVRQRKLRLFAVTCCRRVWHHLADERSKQAIDISERFADGSATKEELTRAWHAANSASHDRQRLAEWAGSRDWYYAGKLDYAAHVAAALNLNPILVLSWANEEKGYTDRWREARREQSLLLRDLFGNPLRSVTICPAVLAWNDSTVVRLAQAAYEERLLPEGTLDNGRLAVLADALEEAGCSDADILGHLRGPGPHVRGCWVIDSLLGKS